MIRFLKDNWPELTIIALLFIDLFFKVIPIVPAIAVILLLQMIRLDISANAFLFISISSVIIGAALNTAGIAGLGGLSIVFGVGLLGVGMFLKKIHIRKNIWQGLTMLLIILLFFAISAACSKGGDFAGEKLKKTIETGLLTWVGFTILFSNLPKINTDRLSLYVIIYACYLMRLSILTNMIEGPANLLSIGFMRFQSILILGYEPTVFNINYQFPGAYFLQGLGIFMTKKHSNKSVVAFIFLIGMIISLYAGARQMMVAIVALAMFWLILENRKTGIIVSSLLIICVIAMYFSIPALKFLFAGTIENGYIEGGGRGDWMMAGINLFRKNPLVGVGFGRYNLFGDYTTYPHNLFIEILCETGILGFLFIFGILVYGLYLSRGMFMKYEFYLAGLFLMSMASGCMYDNIPIFSIVFSSILIKDRCNDGKRLQTDKSAKNMRQTGEPVIR